jgi:hypothetical protein
LQKLLITYGNDACPYYVGVWGKGGKEEKKTIKIPHNSMEM